MSPSLLRLGQVLRERLGTYVVPKEIQEIVWLARDQAEQTVVVKGVRGHLRAENERNVFKRFQGRTAFLRPLTDEIEDPSYPTIIILSHLDGHLLSASMEKPLNRKELKYVSRRILEALKVLHEDGYVHTDVKLDNVFVNYKEQGDDNRLSDIQLGDLGGTYPADSKWTRQGTPVGAPMWSSPEVIMETLGTQPQIFGLLALFLIYGGNFNLFRPKTVPYGHEEYGLEVLKQQFRYFGPFPGKYDDIASQMTVAAILYLMQEIPQSETTPFSRTMEREVSKEDKEFIGRIMVMDWRDRPTAKELLEDKWFQEVE